MVSLRLEKVTELATATKKNTMQQEAARSDGSQYVGASQTRLHHVHNQNFKPAAPTSGDKIINKRRFSPLVACVSLSGWCENGCGSIQSPIAHGGDDGFAGEWFRANAYYHNMEQRIWGLQYWLRRWVAANRQKIAVKWCASGAGARAGEANRLVTSAAQRICMVVAVTGANSVCHQGRCWVLGAGA